MPTIENDVRIYGGPAPDGGPTPSEPLLSAFLDQVGKRVHAYFEAYIKEDLKEGGPRQSDLWGMFRSHDHTIYIYVARIGVLWWVRKLLASIDDASIEDAVGRCGLVLAASRPATERRTILVIDGIRRTRYPDIQRAVGNACWCLRDHMKLAPDQGRCEMLWSGIPPPGLPTP